MPKDKIKHRKTSRTSKRIKSGWAGDPENDPPMPKTESGKLGAAASPWRKFKLR